jgi:hypothetical protein
VFSQPRFRSLSVTRTVFSPIRDIGAFESLPSRPNRSTTLCSTAAVCV